MALTTRRRPPRLGGRNTRLSKRVCCGLRDGGGDGGATKERRRIEMPLECRRVPLVSALAHFMTGMREAVCAVCSAQGAHSADGKQKARVGVCKSTLRPPLCSLSQGGAERCLSGFPDSAVASPGRTSISARSARCAVVYASPHCSRAGGIPAGARGEAPLHKRHAAVCFFAWVFPLQLAVARLSPPPLLPLFFSLPPFKHRLPERLLGRRCARAVSVVGRLSACVRREEANDRTASFHSVCCASASSA